MTEDMHEAYAKYAVGRAEKGERADAWYQKNWWYSRTETGERAQAEMFWVDIETSGLSVDSDPILEVAFVATDRDGYVLGRFSEFIAPEGGVENLRAASDSYVRTMHDKSGIWIASSAGVSVAFAAESLNDFLHAFAPLNEDGSIKKLPLSGSSVHFDRTRLEVVPEFAQVMERFFTYRNIDISTVKGLCDIHNPTLAKDLSEELDPIGLHEGLADISDTINQYRALVAEFLWTERDANLVLGLAKEGEDE